STCGGRIGGKPGPAQGRGQNPTGGAEARLRVCERAPLLLCPIVATIRITGRSSPAKRSKGGHMRVINRILSAVLAAAAFLAMFSAAPAFADPVKIGILLPYSGPFARLGDTMQKAIDLWVKQHGDAVAGNTIELIKRDAAGADPAVAKRLAQELITRDHVQFLTGFVLTPEAFA